MIMHSLATECCHVCDSSIKPLSVAEARHFLVQLNGWILQEEAKDIQQTFTFKNYYHTMAFVNAVAWIAHQTNHHPDMEVSYKNCVVRYTTHAIGGLSKNDFICAAKVDALFATQQQNSSTDPVGEMNM